MTNERVRPGRHKVEVSEHDRYVRRASGVVAKKWDGDPVEVIRWLAISGLEGTFFPSNGVDYSSQDQIAVRSEMQRDSHWGNRGDWFVVEGGAISVFTEVEFVVEFEKEAESMAGKVRRYADERRAHGSRATVGSWRIASDLYQMLGIEWPE